MRKWNLITLVSLVLLSSCAPVSVGQQKFDKEKFVKDGFVQLFNGKDLAGWKIPEGDNGHWKVVDGVIDYDAQSEAKGSKNLWTQDPFGDYILHIEWRFKRTTGLYAMPTIGADGSYKTDADGSVIKTPTPNADSGIFLRGTGGSQVNLWCWPIGSGELWSVRNNKKLTPELRAAAVPKVRADKPVGQWNSMDITMMGDRVTVMLNGKTVIENAQIPGILERGPIGLQHHGGLNKRTGEMSPASSLIQFRNVWVKAIDSKAEGLFTLVPDAHGMVLKTPDGRTVLRYMTKKPADTKLTANSVCCLYPVNTPSGERVVDFAPSDHPHHRGAFLAWHSLKGKQKADFWGWGAWAPTKGRVIKNRSIKLVEADSTHAILEVRNAWDVEGEAMINEVLSITASEQSAGRLSADNAYVIDLHYQLTPTVEVTLDKTAFGGFCVKARKDGKSVYTSPKGEVKLPNPHHLKPETDWPPVDWYDYTIKLNSGKTIGVTVFDHPANPPTTWHNLRTISMVNPCIVAPGAVTMKKAQPFNLRYRLVVHDGPAPIKLLKKLSEPWRGSRSGETFKLEEGFVRLDNGKDLEGWAGFKRDWSVVSGAIHLEYKSPPTGGSIFSKKTHSNNAVIRLQFRASHGGDSGVFIHGNQFQVRDYPNSYPDTKKYAPFCRPAGQWNDLEFDITNGVAVVKLNGTVIHTGWKIGERASQGIGLQKEKGNFDYRYIRLKEKK